MASPTRVTLTIDNQPIAIKVFGNHIHSSFEIDSNDDFKNSVSLHDLPNEVRYKAVNIFASGPSIDKVIFDKSLLTMPSIFVNGSLKLIGDYSFDHVIAYVISDDRFIKHNGDILNTYYQGQPFYCTLAVIKAIAAKYPELIKQYHKAMQIIYPVDRPLTLDVDNKNRIGNFITKRLRGKKCRLSQFYDHPNFVIDSVNHSHLIGVSLDMRDGFVEAGTVAYVAAQLAYSLGTAQINLHGIDLINSDQPRFYEHDDNAAPCKLDKAISDRIVPSFDLMSREYKKHGVEVINYSPVSQGLFKNLKGLSH